MNHNRIPKEGFICFWALEKSNEFIPEKIVSIKWQQIENRRAALFNGNDSKIEIGDDSCFEIQEDISIFAWIYKKNYNNFERWDAILAKNGMNKQWDYELLISKAKSDELAFYAQTCTPNEVYSGIRVEIGKWQHVGVTRAGDQVSFYFDGHCVNIETMTGKFPISKSNLLIGKDGMKAGNAMDGYIRGVALYNRALTQEEILTLYSESKNGL